jgi:hypothetical protein
MGNRLSPVDRSQNAPAKWEIAFPVGRDQSALRTETFCAELRLIRSTTMWDVIMLAIGLGFFLLSIGYTLACDRL